MQLDINYKRWGYLIATVAGLLAFTGCQPAVGTVVNSSQPTPALPLACFVSPLSTADLPVLSVAPTAIPTASSLLDESYKEIALPAIGDAESGVLQLAWRSGNYNDRSHSESYIKRLKETEYRIPTTNTISFPIFPVTQETLNVGELVCGPRELRVIYGNEDGIYQNTIDHCGAAGDSTIEFNGYAYRNISGLAHYCPPNDDPEEQSGSACTLVISDGTAENTILPRFKGIEWLTDFGNAIIFQEHLYFQANVRIVARSPYVGSVTECSIWRSKGPPASIHPILSIENCVISSKHTDELDIATDDQRLYIYKKGSLYQSDGTKSGTQLVHENFHSSVGATEFLDLAVTDQTLHLVFRNRMLVYDIVNLSDE